MNTDTSDIELPIIEAVRLKFEKALQDFADGIKLKKHKRGDLLLKMQKSISRCRRKWNKSYLSNYISKN